MQTHSLCGECKVCGLCSSQKDCLLEATTCLLAGEASGVKVSPFLDVRVLLHKDNPRPSWIFPDAAYVVMRDSWLMKGAIVHIKKKCYI